MHFDTRGHSLRTYKTQNSTYTCAQQLSLSKSLSLEHLDLDDALLLLPVTVCPNGPQA